MALKDFTALLIGEGGKYTCSDDIMGSDGRVGELDLYHALRNSIQKDVDYVKEQGNYSEAELTAYAFRGERGETFLKIKECLESNGYDTSNLPYVEVPEFGVPGIGTAITVGAMGGLLGYRKLRNYLSERKDRKNS